MHLCEVQAVSSRNQARSFLRLSIAIHDYHAIFNDRQLIVRFVFDTFSHMLNRQRKQCTVYPVLALFGHLLTTALFHHCHLVFVDDISKQKLQMYLYPLWTCYYRDHTHSLQHNDTTKQLEHLVTHIHIFETPQIQKSTRCLSCLETSPLKT
jgi:hypothetical protein